MYKTVLENSCGKTSVWWDGFCAGDEELMRWSGGDGVKIGDGTTPESVQLVVSMKSLMINFLIFCPSQPRLGGVGQVGFVPSSVLLGVVRRGVVHILSKAALFFKLEE